jgi:hypothetical protein
VKGASLTEWEPPAAFSEMNEVTVEAGLSRRRRSDAANAATSSTSRATSSPCRVNRSAWRSPASPGRAAFSLTSQPFPWSGGQSSTRKNSWPLLFAGPVSFTPRRSEGVTA